MGLSRADAAASEMPTQDGEGERREMPWPVSSSHLTLSQEFLPLSKACQMFLDLEPRKSGYTEQGMAG